MGRTRSYFRAGLSVSGWLFCAMWLLMTIPSFFHLMGRFGESTLEVIWTFLVALHIALAYLLYFWWLVIPVTVLPPFIGSVLDEREAIKAREQAEVK